jgi:hypothetical protein
VAVDSDGNVYVADNDTIRKVTASSASNEHVRFASIRPSVGSPFVQWAAHMRSSTVDVLAETTTDIP